MRILEGPEALRFVRGLEKRGATDLAKVEPAVRRIVRDVRRNGDRALRRYSTRLDGLGKLQPMRVPEVELKEAWGSTSTNLQSAIERATANIRRYCELQ